MLSPAGALNVMGTNTVSVADVALPVPPSADATAVGPLVYAAVAVTVTLTARVQELPAATVAPDRLTLPLPATATAPPPQVLLNPLGDATNRSGGNVSVKATPVSATVLASGLVMV
jgi:hypothetical protein